MLFACRGFGSVKFPAAAKKGSLWPSRCCWTHHPRPLVMLPGDDGSCGPNNMCRATSTRGTRDLSEAPVSSRAARQRPGPRTSVNSCTWLLLHSSWIELLPPANSSSSQSPQQFPEGSSPLPHAGSCVSGSVWRRHKWPRSRLSSQQQPAASCMTTKPEKEELLMGGF